MILLLVDVVVLVDKDPAEACEQSLALFVRLLGRQSLAAQQGGRLAQQLAEVVVGKCRSIGEVRAGEVKRHAVAGQDGDAPGIRADEFVQAAANLDGRVAVVGECEDAAGGLPANAQVGDAVYQYAGLAGARARQDQDVGLLAVVGDDAPLRRVVEALDDGPPGLRRGLPRQVRTVRQPAAQECVPVQGEVVHRQLQGGGDRGEPAVDELLHDVDLQDLFLVVQFQRGEVRAAESPPGFLHANGHRRAKHRKALVEADDLLFVQPEQGPVQQLARIPDPAPELQVRFDRLEKLAQGGLDQEVRALNARLKLLPQMLQEHLCGRAAPTGGFKECRPVAIQFHADLIAVQTGAGRCCPGRLRPVRPC